MEEGNDFDSTVFVSFEFEEGGRCEELSTLRWKETGNIHELVIVYTLCTIIRK